MWWVFLIYYAFKLSGTLQSPAVGAYNNLFAATSPTASLDKRRYAGAYLAPVGVIAEPSKEAQDPVAAQSMWDTTEKVLSEMYA